MKIQIKSKINLIKAISFATLLLIFHFLGHYGSIPYVSNFAPQPFEWEKIELKETIYPSYRKPFRKLEYRYSEKQKNKIVLAEKAESVFSRDIPRDICKFARDILKIEGANKCMEKLRKDKSQNLQIFIGDSTQYYNSDTDGDFMRGFAAGDDYPNWLFFIIQYFLTVAFIFFLYKSVTIKKK